MNTTTKGKVVAEVYATKDYSLFKSLDGNRSVLIPHLKKLKQSIESEYLLSPILVNERHEIIDGQHRFQVLQELNLPIYYLIKKGYGLKEVQLLNANTKNWSTDDYLQSYVELGFEEYKMFKLFKQQFQFGWGESMALLAGNITGGGLLGENFKNGLFKIKDYKKAIQDSEKILMVGKYYPGIKRRSFVLAMLKCFNNKDFNHSLFLSKLEYQSTKLVDCTDEKQYLTLIEEIYNFKSRSPFLSLRF